MSVEGQFREGRGGFQAGGWRLEAQESRRTRQPRSGGERCMGADVVIGFAAAAVVAGRWKEIGRRGGNGCRPFAALAMSPTVQS